MFHIFGDSHAEWGWNSIKGVNIHSFSGSLCHSFGRDGLFLVDISNPKYEVNENDAVAFIFGEIDCSCHVHKFITPSRSFNNVIKQLVDDYFNAILLNIFKFQKPITVAVCSIPPAVEKDTVYFTKDDNGTTWVNHRFLGTDEERKQYVICFNSYIKEYCKEYNYIFIDFHDDYRCEKGFLSRKYSCTSVHIKDPIFIEKALYASNIHPSYNKQIASRKKCTVVGHTGWTDFISQYCLYRHFIQEYDDIIIFVDNENKRPFLKLLFPESNVSIQVAQYHLKYTETETCMRCITNGSSNGCPRKKTEKCIYIDYTHYTGYKSIQLNGFHNYNNWSTFSKDKSFLSSMYLYHNLDFLECVAKYKIPINHIACEEFYYKFKSNTPYILIHDSQSNGYTINNNTSYPSFNLDNISPSILDTIYLLKEAKELHLIDSIYAFLSLLLYLQYNYFKDTIVFIYCRNKDTNGPLFAIQPFIPKHWTIIYQ
jgi:hypothetical protein